MSDSYCLIKLVLCCNLSFSASQDQLQQSETQNLQPVLLDPTLSCYPKSALQSEFATYPFQPHSPLLPKISSTTYAQPQPKISSTTYPQPHTPLLPKISSTTCTSQPHFPLLPKISSTTCTSQPQPKISSTTCTSQPQPKISSTTCTSQPQPKISSTTCTSQPHFPL